MKFAYVSSMATTAFMLAFTSPSIAADATPLAVQSGHSIVLRETILRRVAVGDGKIAGVLPVGTDQLVVNGKSPGRTTLFVWTDSGRKTYEVTVTAQGAYDFESMLRSSITYPNVRVVSFGTTAIVRGTVDNGEELASLQDIITRLNGSGSGTSGGGLEPSQKINIVNVVTVVHPLGSLQTELAGMKGVENLRVDPDAKGNIIVSGTVDDRVAAEHILGRVRGLSGPYLGVDGKIIDRLEANRNTEIDVKVQIVEVNKTAQSQLGLSLQSAIFNPQSGTYSYSTAQFPVIEGPAGAQVGRGFNVSGGFLRLSFLAPTLTALISHGDAHMLAEPHLTTVPGTEASFLVGGEIPYVMSSALGQASIEFKQYGVNLKVTPTILPNGSIKAEIAPDISNLDYANAVTLNGYAVPALKESKMSTVAIARPGESIMMGGLVDRISQKTVSEFPILGQLPILGKLFRSTSYQSSNSDVVFIMTPQIVNN